MSKHIVDQNRSTENQARTVRFTRIEGKQVPSPQTKALQRRPLATDPQNRAKRFWEIERRGVGGV